ncbi:Abieta-7,13-dien-18-ol hydroxylase [Bertholletia excelsa]
MRETSYGGWSYMMVVMMTTMAGVISLAVYFLYLNKKNGGGKGRKPKMPPGRRGWPLIGDSFNWYSAVASSHPPRFVEQQVRRYGKIFCCSVFGKWAVVSADPSFNRFVMQNEGKLFESSYPKSFRDLVGKKGVITVQGELQRKLHGIASNMMRLDTLKFHFLHHIQKVLIQTFDNLPNNHPLLLQDLCRKVAINLMVNQLLGASTQEEVNEMARLFSDFADGCLSLPFNFPGFAYRTAMKAREVIISKINKKIERHEGQGGLSETDNGVLGRLLEEESLPNDVVADFIINLLFAGNETTAKTMLFAVYFLTHSPRAMKQLMDEHQKLRCQRSSLDGEDLLTWNDYKEMSLTQCVIDETLRMAGIAIWLMREAKKDVEYQGYLIPKGCFVVPFLSAVHLDENIYEGALTFNPWRWMDVENQEKRNWRSSPSYSPFGGGARLCPGAELARLQIALFLHYFVTTFRWTQVKEDRMSFFPSARLVNGFPIQIARRDDQLKRK